MMDLRLPSGLFFTVLGLILVGMGVFAPETRAALTEANVNLYAGLAMLVFGVVMLILAKRASGKA
jgi:predicted phage tail protein